MQQDKPKCSWCNQPITPSERLAPNFSQPTHDECGFRAILGSLAHLGGRCACYVPGSTEGDPPGMSKREAARAAMDYWNTLTDTERQTAILRGNHAAK